VRARARARTDGRHDGEAERHRIQIRPLIEQQVSACAVVENELRALVTINQTVIRSIKDIRLRVRGSFCRCRHVRRACARCLCAHTFTLTIVFYDHCFDVPHFQIIRCTFLDRPHFFGDDTFTIVVFECNEDNCTCVSVYGEQPPARPFMIVSPKHDHPRDLVRQ
jgi:hypothetical protein